MENALIIVANITAVASFILIPAMVAYFKGHSFVVWFIFSLFLWPVAMLASIFTRGRGRGQLDTGGNYGLQQNDPELYHSKADQQP